MDLCTGSGCIAVSIKAYQKNSVVEGFDISREALNVAERNASDNQTEVKFVQSDLFSEAEGRYDMIVSNPPYIPSAVIPTLMPEVRDHEPVGALDGMEDGLYFYRKIVAESGAYLKPGGYLLFEIGAEQGAAVSGLMREYEF
ncbi:MAG: HemK/PrmC family methyltransferase [Eubacterium sp.]